MKAHEFSSGGKLPGRRFRPSQNGPFLQAALCIPAPCGGDLKQHLSRVRAGGRRASGGDSGFPPGTGDGLERGKADAVFFLSDLVDEHGILRDGADLVEMVDFPVFRGRPGSGDAGGAAGGHGYGPGKSSGVCHISPGTGRGHGKPDVSPEVYRGSHKGRGHDPGGGDPVYPRLLGGSGDDPKGPDSQRRTF